MINNENFIVIQGFMVNELKLKGNELLVYAIIYGFSQDNTNRFTGSLSYLAEWTNSTKQGVIKNLKSLIEKGLIEKHEKEINGVKFCEYNVSEFNSIKQSLMGGIKHSLPNNIDNNNIVNNIKKESKKKKSEIDELIENYTSNPELIEAIEDFIKMRKSIKAPLTTRALKNILTKLDKLASTDSDKINILDQSINNSWRGIFELKDKQIKPNKPKYKTDW